MTAAWVLYVLLVGALAALAAASVAAATRAVGRPTRWVWAAALAGLAVLAVVAPRQEPTRLRVATTIETSAPTIARQPVASMDLVARLRAARDLAAEEGTSALASAARAVPRPVTIAFAAAWAAGSAALLALFVAVNLRLARARRRWPASRTCGTPVRVAPHSGPAVLGLLRAEIVVPRSLLERSAEEQRLILVHEREHLRARDHLLLAGAWLVAIALPWHPAVWAMLARLRLAIELDCDARVIHAGVSPKSYGALLIDVAVHHEGIRIGALALADGPSHLERRILAMNAPRRRHARTYGAVLGGLGTLLVLAACEAKIPTSADIAAMDVASAQKSAAEAGFMRAPSNDRTDFFLNGVKVSAEQARALEAKNIGSIEVVKSERPEGRDTIFVTTADRMPRRSETPDSFEAARFGGSELAFKRKAMSDSGEHTVAHVERELAGVRTRASDAGSMSKAPPQMLKRSAAGGEPAPVILIDGRRASERDLAALDEKDIASVAVYKGQDALNMRAKATNGLEVTSRPASRTGTSTAGAVISVTTKLAKTRTKQP